MGAEKGKNDHPSPKNSPRAPEKDKLSVYLSILNRQCFSLLKHSVVSLLSHTFWPPHFPPSIPSDGLSCTGVFKLPTHDIICHFLAGSFQFLLSEQVPAALPDFSAEADSLPVFASAENKNFISDKHLLLLLLARPPALICLSPSPLCLYFSAPSR